MGHVEICSVLERYTGHNDEGGDTVFQRTNRMAAVKVMYIKRVEHFRRRHAQDPMEETAIMQLLGDKPIHVINCIEVLSDDKNIYVTMPYADSSDLMQLLVDKQTTTSQPNAFTEGEARFWFRQVMQGVAFLHAKGIFHSCLSLDCIFVAGNQVMIIGLDMCLRVPYMDPKNPDGRVDVSCSNGTSRCLIKPRGAIGKLPFMSPEIYLNRDPFDGAAANIWTCGTILFCMLTGCSPYQRPHLSDPQFYWMTRGLPQLLAEWNVNISNEGVNLLQRMLQLVRTGGRLTSVSDLLSKSNSPLNSFIVTGSAKSNNNRGNVRAPLV